MDTIALTRRYPGLEALSRVDLAIRPTPVDDADGLGDAVGVAGLYVKREDLSGDPYGGNKVRKLEFLLGDASAQGRTSTITFGAAGSNHALATAVYASRAGLDHYSLLSPQPNARYVRKNLRYHVAQGVDIRFGADFDAHEPTVEAITRFVSERDGVEPYVIPVGGTSPLGTMGPIDAALEFAEQVAAGEVPEPDVVYVPLGSLGTVAGVAVGLAAAGLSSRVIAVRVTPQDWANHETLGPLVEQTVALARSVDPTFPELRYADLGVEIRDEFYGAGYAHFTSQGIEAVRTASRFGYQLEGTYSGKTFGALMADARAGRLEGMKVLFWLTYNSRDIAVADDEATDRLPAPLHAYLVEPFQELDRADDEDEGQEGA